MQENLTKGNFWDEMMVKYPLSMARFCKWVDDYKVAANWHNLFLNGVKFHHLPYAMQQGIWIDFVNEIINELYEQPEYAYSGDLRDDIDVVFADIEPELAAIES